MIRNENKKKINGKNCNPLFPIFCSTSVLLKRKISSKTDCHLVGIILLLLFINIKNKINKLRLKNVKIVEFVILKYKFL